MVTHPLATPRSNHARVHILLILKMYFIISRLTAAFQSDAAKHASEVCVQQASCVFAYNTSRHNSLVIIQRTISPDQQVSAANAQSRCYMCYD